jgi:surfeit locus 1 family protein
MGVRARRLAWPALTTAILFAVLIALGTWQVQRLAWKRGILDRIAQAEASDAEPLPPEPTSYAKVRAVGRFRPDATALYGAEVHETVQGPLLGAQLLAVLDRADAPPVLVDRGWVPLQRTRPLVQTAGEVAVEGFVRPRATAGLFSAPDDAAGRHFYTLDPAAICGVLGVPGCLPFTLVATGPAPADGYPDPARHLPRPDNNHLSYAITWYGLAGALLVVFGVYARRSLRA